MRNFTKLNFTVKILLFSVFLIFIQSISAKAQTSAKALNFDGINDYVAFSSSTNLNISKGTVEAYVNIPSGNRGNSNDLKAIVAKQYAYGLFVLNGKLVTYDWQASTLTDPNAPTIDDNTWHHVALAFSSGVPNASRLYIDGVPVGIPFTYTISNNDNNLAIGAGTANGTSQFLNGTIDEVRIWNRQLGDCEIFHNKSCELSATGQNGLVALYNFNQGIVGANNSTITTLNDATITNNGILNNFALNGITSNWVSGNLSTVCTVFAPPVSAISAGSATTTFCQGNSVVLNATSNSSNSGVTYQWQKDGSNITSATSNYYTATTTGAYSLIITTSEGCSAKSNTIGVTVNSLPTIFDVSGGGVYCAGTNGVSIALSGSETGVNYQLKLGNSLYGSAKAGTGSPISFDNLVQAGDSYTIVATNTNGNCVSTMNGSVNVTVSSVKTTTPIISVNSGSSVLCPNATVQLCPLNYGYSNYQWYLNGNAVSTGTCITVGENAVGSYTLKATNGFGCWSDISTAKIVSLATPNSKPTISVAGSTNVCSNSPVTLTSSSASDNQWYKNGSPLGITTSSISVTNAGSYTVVVGSGTCASGASDPVIITNNPPTSSFTIVGNTTQCLSGNTFGFTNTSTGANLTYIWYFSDGSTSTAASPTHSYVQAGSYNVQLDVSNACGTNSSIKTVVVNPTQAAPQSISGKNAMVVGDVYKFTDGTTGGVWSTSNSGVVTVANDGTVTAAGVGTADVVYTVTGTCGTASSKLTVVVSAACVTPTSSFTIVGNTTQCLSGNTFGFTNTSTGTNLTYTWYFGDGSSSTSSSPTHVYTQKGTYTVQLSASNSCGNNSTTTTVTVNDKPETPQSISGRSSMIVAESYVFSSGTSGTKTWSSSDPTVASVDAASGNVTALKVGTTTISYTVSNGCGTSSPAQLVVNVSEAPLYISVYPNPTTTAYIQVGFVAPTNTATTISIYSLGGTFQKSTIVYPTSVGSYVSTTIDISNLANGTYVVTVVNGNGMISSKQFIKQ